MFKESETIESKKSTAEVKAGAVSMMAMLNKYGKGNAGLKNSDYGVDNFRLTSIR